MARRLTIEITESGALAIAADIDEADEGFYPGEVAAILEEAAKMVSRSELVEHWHAVAQRQLAEQNRPNILVPR